MSRAIAFTWGLGLVLVAASPLFRDPQADDFPLSTFPMFAEPVAQTAFYSAEGVRRDGSRVRLLPELIANGAAMQAVETLQNAHSQGARALGQLCDSIASRAAKQSELAELERVELVSARYDPVSYFVSSTEPSSRKVLKRCRVPAAP